MLGEPTTVTEDCGAAKVAAPAVDDGEAAGSHAASAINAATQADRATLVERRDFGGAENEDPSTVAPPSCLSSRFAKAELALAAVLELDGDDNAGVVGWPQPGRQPVRHVIADERRFPDNSSMVHVAAKLPSWTV